MGTKTRWWWKWHGSVEHEHGRVTYFCGTVNEVTVNLPSFEQAHQLRDIAPRVSRHAAAARTHRWRAGSGFAGQAHLTARISFGHGAHCSHSQGFQHRGQGSWAGPWARGQVLTNALP